MNYLVAAIAAGAILVVRFLVPVKPERKNTMKFFKFIPSSAELAEFDRLMAQQKNPGTAPAASPAVTYAAAPPLTVGRIALAVFLGNLLTAAVVAALYFLFTAH